MKNVDAQFILRSCRPGGEDAQDPVFKEALDQAHHDPALRTWLEQERQWDQTLQAKLENIQPPPALLGEMLALQYVAATSSPTFWRRPAHWLAMAAALVVLMAGGLLWQIQRGPALSYEAFPRMASTMLRQPFQLDARVASLDEATQWLQGQQVPWDDVPVSDALSAQAGRGVGCKTFTWRDTEVYLLCFFLDDGTVAHFWMMDMDALPDAPAYNPDAAPQWAQHGRYTTATWHDGSRAFVLASKAERPALELLL